MRSLKELVPISMDAKREEGGGDFGRVVAMSLWWIKLIKVMLVEVLQTLERKIFASKRVQKDCCGKLWLEQDYLGIKYFDPKKHYLFLQSWKLVESITNALDFLRKHDFYLFKETWFLVSVSDVMQAAKTQCKKRVYTNCTYTHKVSERGFGQWEKMAMGGINLCVSLDLQAVEIEFDAKIWLLILNMQMLRLWSQPGFFFFVVLIGKL